MTLFLSVGALAHRNSIYALKIHGILYNVYKKTKFGIFKSSFITHRQHRSFTCPPSAWSYDNKTSLSTQFVQFDKLSIRFSTHMLQHIKHSAIVLYNVYKNVCKLLRIKHKIVVISRSCVAVTRI